MLKGGDGAFIIDARAKRWRPAQTAVALLIYLILFHVLFRISELFEVQAGISSWYPAAGLRFAFLLLFGWRFGIGAFAVELLQAPIHELFGFWVWREEGALTIGRFGALLIAVAAPPFCYSLAAIVIECRGLLTERIEAFARVFWFCGAAAAGAALTAIVSTTNLAINGKLPTVAMREAILAWWSGDLVGIFTVAPALVMVGRWWLQRGGRVVSEVHLSPSKSGPSLKMIAAESMVMIAIVAILLGTATDYANPLRWYPILLPVSWLSLRFSLPGAVFGILASSIGVATLTSLWQVHDALIDVDVLLVVLSVSGLLMGSVVSTLQMERASLDRRVCERTQDLNAEVRRRRIAEHAAIESKRRAERYLSIARTTMVALDTDGRVQMINDEGCRLLGRGRDTILRRDWVNLAVFADERDKVRHVLSKILSRADVPHDSFECRIVTRNGEHRVVDWRTTVVRDGDDGVIGTLSSGVDITERLATERRVRFLANHDAVTGLHNRNWLFDQFAGAVARARRSDAMLVVLFIDLDGFKSVNDDFGHAAGDHVLAEVAQRLLSCVRETDTVTRFGGDEFVVLLEGLTDCSVVASMAEKILDTLSHPIAFGDEALRVGASIGIACCPDDGEDPIELIRLADAAMYVAKKTPGNTYIATSPLSLPGTMPPLAKKA